MQYRGASTIQDELSLLGYGCMRFTRGIGGIDQEKAEREMAYALEHGVNYFDTAYIYPGSEEALGKFAAKDGNRAKMLIATKLPQYMVKSITDVDRIFNEELARLQTDYVDYYLMHMLADVDAWQRMVQMGIVPWIEQKKAEGKIRHIGFSYHGGREEFVRLLDAYSWEFVQIQLNYLDAGAQAGLAGLKAAAERGLPVIIMEPLRGGKLAGLLPDTAKAIFNEANAGREQKLSLVGWALRWLFDLPEVTCVLSGMNDISQVRENVELASSCPSNSLSDEDRDVYRKAVEAIRAVEKVPCTGCGYCMPCPRGIDIPTCFHAYNSRYTEGWMTAFMRYGQCTLVSKKPNGAGECIKCGKCARHCPQHINIPEAMADVQKTLEGPIYKIARKIRSFI